MSQLQEEHFETYCPTAEIEKCRARVEASLEQHGKKIKATIYNLPSKVAGNLHFLRLAIQTMLDFCLQFSLDSNIEFICDCKTIVKEEHKYFVQFMAVVERYDQLDAYVLEMVDIAFTKQKPEEKF